MKTAESEIRASHLRDKIKRGAAKFQSFNTAKREHAVLRAEKALAGEKNYDQARQLVDQAIAGTDNRETNQNYRRLREGIDRQEEP